MSGFEFARSQAQSAIARIHTRVPAGWAGAMMHYDGTAWTNIGIVRHGFEIEHVGTIGPDEAWATGAYLGGGQLTDFTITLLHYSAGIWRVYPLTSIVAIP